MFSNLGGPTFWVILLVILLLFGAAKLPALAKGLGESARVFKGEMKGLKEDEAAAAAAAAAAEAAAATPAATTAADAAAVEKKANDDAAA